MSGKKFRVSTEEKDLDIEEASLQEQAEEQELQDIINQGLNEVETSEPSPQNKSYVKNVIDQKTVNMDEVGKNSSGEKKRIDFMKEAAVNEFTKSESKKSENKTNQKNDSFTGKSMNEVQNEIRFAEENDANKYTPEDFREFASMIMLFIDTIFSETLKWFSKDKDSDYSLPKPKQERLTKSLTYILIKYQSRFPIGWVFIISLVMCYAPAFIAANDKRKKNKAKAVVIPVSPNVYQAPVQQNQQYQQTNEPVQETQTYSNEPIIEDIDIIQEELNSNLNDQKKKYSGRGRKKKIK